ncbi:putative DNA polymerase III, clamp loader complex, gamma/delta/delta subunit [Helianthus debilis subsp. tardiflorus]
MASVISNLGPGNTFLIAVAFRLFQVRGNLYELLVNSIPPEIILKRLLFELLKKLDSELKHEVCHWAAYYEHRMRLDRKLFFTLKLGGLPLIPAQAMTQQEMTQEPRQTKPLHTDFLSFS